MKLRNTALALLAASLAVSGEAASDATTKAKPPMAKKNAKVVTLHGETLKDEYFWMREKDNPEVKAYLDAENAYTDEVMKGTEALQKTIYDEMLGRIKETDLSVPFRKGDYFYYYRTEKGKQYRIYCRKKGSLDAPEQVTLDLNEFGKDSKFVGLGTYQISDDANLLAYSIDLTGFREYTLVVKDLRTGESLPERIPRVWGAAWSADSKTLFYTTEDHAKRPYRLWRHRAGSDPASDQLLYEEKDEMFRVYTYRSRSRGFLFAISASHTASESRYLRADEPQGEFRVLLARAKDREHDVDHRGDLFYIRINDKGRNFRVVTAPVANPAPENWKEIVPHRDDVMVDSIDVFAGHLVLSEWAEGFPRLTVMNLADGRSHPVAMPEPVYSVSLGNNAEFETATLRYEYESFTTPESVYDYDMEGRKAVLLKRTEVLGGYDPSRYESQRLFAKAADGTKIPISLVQKKGTKRDGRNPLLLDGYGSYGAAYSADFNSNRFSLLDRGVIFAIAHIRGGGEMGKKWHDAGRMMSKKTTFTDFIAVAEHLIAEKYTSKDRLAIEGGSAGGLLMGAVANMRPDLFKVVISRVPFVDVINTMLDESIPLTVPEFEEWGNPKNPEHYAYMKSYSPYDNVAARDYPTMLVKTSFNDSQVMYWEPAKYVARLRAAKTDKNPLVFKINMAGGHGGSSGRYDKLREIAFDYAFLITQLGVEKTATAATASAPTSR
jgi:oligopeptidase B